MAVCCSPVYGCFRSWNNSSRYQIFSSALPVTLTCLIFIFLLIAFTSVVNFTNFMDGLDGLVAWVYGCINIFCVLYARFPLEFLGSCWFAFGLYWNWYPLRYSWGMLAVLFLVLYLLAWFFNPQVGSMFLVVFLCTHC